MIATNKLKFGINIWGVPEPIDYRIVVKKMKTFSNLGTHSAKNLKIC